MKLRTEVFGKSGEREVLLHSLESDSGVRIQTTELGASLVSFRVPDDAAGPDGREITLGFDSLEEYQANPAFFGVTVGPIANRIGGAAFSLGGKDYELEANDGKNSLHSGPSASFAFKVWDSQVYEAQDAVGVIYSIVSPDGEGGFPGTQSVAAGYWLTRAGELIMTYAAETRGLGILNLTNHAYWNLAGEGRGLVYDHNLTIHADRFLAVDDGLIPTGELAEVGAGAGDMDFRLSKPIGRDIDHTEGGYDHCYVLKKDRPAWKPPTGSLPVALNSALSDIGGVRAAAVAEYQGLVMEVYTDQPAVQFYSGNMLKGVIGRHGIAHTPRTAFCLETAGYNDAVHQPSFPSWVLEPGQVYRRTTVHKVGGYI